MRVSGREEDRNNERGGCEVEKEKGRERKRKRKREKGTEGDRKRNKDIKSVRKGEKEEQKN